MISVAMATYNGEKYIEKQLLSIICQIHPVDEIVICDDRSTDNTVQIIKNFISNHQNNCTIKLFENESNVGYIRNFYGAIEKAEGDYIFLADQDDIWRPEKTKLMLQVMKDKGLVALCSNCELIDAEDNKIENKNSYYISKIVNHATKEFYPISFHLLAFGNVAQGCTFCFTNEVKKAYLKVNNQTVNHDRQILTIASLMGKVMFWNKELIQYRLHSNNALGFSKKSSKSRLKTKITNKKPFMVQFMDDIERVIPIPNRLYYDLLFYARIPYFWGEFNKRIEYYKGR